MGVKVGASVGLVLGEVLGEEVLGAAVLGAAVLGAAVGIEVSSGGVVTVVLVLVVVLWSVSVCVLPGSTRKKMVIKAITVMSPTTTMAAFNNKPHRLVRFGNSMILRSESTCNSTSTIGPASVSAVMVGWY